MTINERFDYRITIDFCWQHSKVVVLITLERNYNLPHSLPPTKEIKIYTNKEIEDITMDDVNQIVLKFGEELRINHVLFKGEFQC
jgi:hypothetical protein